jgi:hypothetical protein
MLAKDRKADALHNPTCLAIEGNFLSQIPDMPRSGKGE